MTPTEYLDRLRTNPLARESMTDEECRTFGDMLGTKAFRKVMHQMQEVSEEFATMVANADLMTPEGVTQAVKLQGRREGFLSAIDMMLAVPGDTTEESTDGESS